jgi:hypothetical protein
LCDEDGRLSPPTPPAGLADAQRSSRKQQGEQKRRRDAEQDDVACRSARTASMNRPM